jgi:enamine deaminase RidA (YjgF/YER057c/UK114 family)
MLKRINPASLYDSVAYGFSHATLQEGGRTLHLAGQVAWDGSGELVGPGDLGAQTRQALANLRTVLAEVGATPADIVRIRTYIVDHTPDKLGTIAEAMAGFYDGGLPAPNTVIGVAALALPGFLIEIEATAAMPNG